MKKGLNIAANACAIALMGILAVGAFILIILFGAINGADSSAAGSIAGAIADAFSALMVIFLAVLIVVLFFCAGTIAVAALAIARHNRRGGTGLKIAMIALMSTTVILEFAVFSTFYVIHGILCLVPIGLEIAALCVKAPQAAAETTESAAEPQEQSEPQPQDEPQAQSEPQVQEQSEEREDN